MPNSLSDNGQHRSYEDVALLTHHVIKNRDTNCLRQSSRFHWLIVAYCEGPNCIYWLEGLYSHEETGKGVADSRTLDIVALAPSWGGEAGRRVAYA
jgi:hypothetical protein